MSGHKKKEVENDLLTCLAHQIDISCSFIIAIVFSYTNLFIANEKIPQKRDFKDIFEIVFRQH